MSSLNKAIANYRDVDDGGAHYSFTIYSSESTSGTKSSVAHSQTIEHSPSNVNNVVELGKLLHVNIWTHSTEVIRAGDPRAKDHRINEAIAAEIRDWARRGTFKWVMRAEMLPSANVPTARYLLAIKHKISCVVLLKTLYVIGGHRDMLKAFLVHRSRTLQAFFVLVLLVRAEIFNF